MEDIKVIPVIKAVRQIGNGTNGCNPVAELSVSKS